MLKMLQRLIQGHTLGCRAYHSSICVSSSQESKVNSTSPRNLFCPKRSWCHTETCRLRVSSCEWLITYCKTGATRSFKTGPALKSSCSQTHSAHVTNHVADEGEKGGAPHLPGSTEQSLTDSPAGSRWKPGWWSWLWCSSSSCYAGMYLAAGKSSHNWHTKQRDSVRLAEARKHKFIDDEKLLRREKHTVSQASSKQVAQWWRVKKTLIPTHAVLSWRIHIQVFYWPILIPKVEDFCMKMKSFINIFQ